jgi:general L-amino acid transport system permease protein
MISTGNSDEKIPIWRDARFWRVALQIGLLAILAIAGSWFAGNFLRQGKEFNFGFLWNQAGFNIGESLVPYQTNDLYGWALFVGFLNSLRLILIGLVLTTVIGVVAGVASFSSNWLLQKISQVYVEVVRNTPLLLQIFFWYFAVFFSFSTGANVTNVMGTLAISKKGVVIPWPSGTPTSWLALVALVVAAIAAILVWRWRIKLMGELGASGKPQSIALIGLGILSLLIFLFGLGWQFPVIDAAGTNVEGGLRLSLEYVGMLVGLAFYTGAFIAEIVRAGIQSVSKGQWEAAQALGIQQGLSMRLVVLPQALRVIIPSLNSQYINLTKNSSLALAIGYPDIFSTSQTILNQTGRAVEVILIILLTYLVVDLLISVLMNQLNNLVQLRER